VGGITVKVQIESISLEGASRTVRFSEGLNIITGPIASGKTTFFRLIRGILGGSLENLALEARSSVQAIASKVKIGSASFSILRPAVTTRTALVEIAGGKEALRLPFAQATTASEETYLHWLLRQLDLPRIDVPSAPSRPESEPTPVSVNDYLLYCVLSQSEIGLSVFGHADPFKNIKRKYVFEIAYGIYSIETARIQEQLREVQTQLRELRSQKTLFSRFLEDTALQNRAEIERMLEEARAKVHEIESNIQEVHVEAVDTPAKQKLQSDLRRLEQEVSSLQSSLQSETAALDNVERLASQIESQTNKITRSIVAHVHLSDIDFIVCPRCGSELDQSRGSDFKCYLCLQEPKPQITRKALIEEQSSMNAQLSETADLVLSRKKRIDALRKQLDSKQHAAAKIQEEINFQNNTFVSAQASRIARLATERAEARSSVSKLEEYLKIHRRFDESLRLQGELESERDRLERDLESSEKDWGTVQSRVSRLGENFDRILEGLNPPAFGEEKKSTIDPKTYLPVFHGRRFDDLSSPGLGTLINVAHALAHHETSLEMKLLLPSLLMIDGLSEHLGEEGLDPERVEAIYRYLVALSERQGASLQIIVVDNEIPGFAKDFIRLELSEADRLIK
jgi:energy-coupling factor transporter ATP-binding protein EcfA2